jgi:hypothetical protein
VRQEQGPLFRDAALFTLPKNVTDFLKTLPIGTNPITARVFLITLPMCYRRVGNGYNPVVTWVYGIPLPSYRHLDITHSKIGKNRKIKKLGNIGNVFSWWYKNIDYY